MSRTIPQLIALLCIELIIFIPFAYVDALTISNVNIQGIDSGAPTVIWETDNQSTSVAYYGEDPNLDKVQQSSELATSHSLILPDISAGKKFSYIVSSCETQESCVNSSKRSFTAGQDTKSPSIIAKIPKYYNKKRMDISGTTKPYSTVKLYVNDMNVPARILDKNTVGQTGEFEFRDVYLEDTNIIQLWAQDTAGKTNYTIYYTSLDLKQPSLQIDPLLNITRSNNISIRGSVDEESTISIYAEVGSIDLTPPKKITGLRNTSLGSNLIEMNWDESAESDVESYIIYREDVGPIAMTKKKYNSYPDYLVNTDTEYTYRVAAMDGSGNIGLKSDPLAIKTPPGGRIGLNPPKEIEIAPPKKISQSLNTTGAFISELKLTKGDGIYHIKIEAVDKAGNTISIDKEITLDTTAPKIKITKPNPGESIYENFANQVDIYGETEKNSEVYLYVGRTPLGEFNRSLDISGLPNEIQDIPDAKLKADCNLPGTSICPTSADYSTKADANGTFKFNDVDLTSIWSIGGRISSVPTKDLDKYGRELGGSPRGKTEADVVVISSDASGQRSAASAKYNIVTCWSGNFSWDISSLTEYQSPSLLSTQRIADGEEYIYFYLKFTYVGDKEGAEIVSNGVTLIKACDGFNVLNDTNYNMGCDLMSGNAPQPIQNEEGNVFYFAIKLNKKEGMEKWMKDDWESFYDSISGEITFPFKVTVRYKYKDGTSGQNVQTSCIPITYVVDSSRINFKDLLPDWVLYDLVDALNQTVTSIAKIQKEIDKVMQYLGVACLTTIVLKTVFQAIRHISCTAESAKKILERFSGNTDKQEKCAICLKEVHQYTGITDDFKMDKMSDTCLKECYDGCSAAWDREAGIYKWFRYSCDRLFGHKTPSRWTQTLNDDELKAKQETVNSCSTDTSVSGQPIRSVKCADVEGRYKEIHFPGKQPADKKCYEIVIPNSDPAKKGEYYVYTDADSQDLATNNIYTLSLYETRRTTKGTIYAIKDKGDNYLTARSETCSQRCGILPKKDPKEDPREFNFEQPQSQKVSETGDKYWSCTTVKNCESLNGEGATVPLQDGEKKAKSGTRKGYTSDCFYNPETPGLNSVDVVSEKKELRKECCCINTLGNKLDYNYYLPKDVETVNGEAPDPNKGDEAQNYKDMKWSYRYSRIKYEVKQGEKVRNEYNPNRYIDGRDYPACFGWNNWFFDGINKKEGDTGKLLIIDPIRQHTSAFQCLNVGGINKRLQMFANLMTSLQSCLVQVRTTGHADTGVCKEMLSKYVCSFLWEMISWLKDGCLPFGVSIEFDKSEDGYLQAAKNGLKGIFDAVSENQKEIMSEYENAQFASIFGVGEEEVANKICLAAFGYDMEINAKSLVDIAYSSPMPSLVQAFLPTREYMTLNPDSGVSRYDYGFSYIINPGCDMDRYDVSLSCIGSEQIGMLGVDCDKVKDPAGSNCDCQYGKEQLYPLNVGKRLTENVLEDQSFSRVIESQARYDHLKFVLKPHKDISSTKTGLSGSDSYARNCFPEGHYIGTQGVYYFPITDKTTHDITDCKVDITTGTFSCLQGMDFWNSRGMSYFTSTSYLINGKEEPAKSGIEVFEGDKLDIMPTIQHSGPNHCFVVNIKKGGIDEPKAFDININGAHQYAPIIIEEVIKLKGYVTPNAQFWNCSKVDKSDCKKDSSITSKNLRIQLTKQENINQEVFYVSFKDSGNGEISLSENSDDQYFVSEYLGPPTSWAGIGPAYTDRSSLNIGRNDAEFKVDIAEYAQGIDWIQYKVTVPSAKTVRTQEPWTIEYGIYHKKHNDSTSCEYDYNKDDPVKYKGKEQKFTNTFVVKTKDQQAKGAYYNCKGNGVDAETTNCNCKGQYQQDGGPPDFCNLEQDIKYCYNSQCYAFPKCKEKDSAAYPCDCNADGDKDDVSTETTTNDGDCGGENNWKYCYDSNNDNKKECHNEAKGIIAQPVTVPTSVSGDPLVKRLLESGKIKEDFVTKTVEVANAINTDPITLMKIMYYESNRTMSSSVKNPGSSATGLIQFTTDSATKLGTKIEYLESLTPVQQMYWVQKYFEDWKKTVPNYPAIYTKQGCLYVAVLAPAYLKNCYEEGMGITLYSSSSLDPKNKAGYEANKNNIEGTSQDGKITLAEYYNVIENTAI